MTKISELPVVDGNVQNTDFFPVVQVVDGVKTNKRVLFINFFQQVYELLGVVKNDYNASSDPTPDDDMSEGWSKGSERWNPTLRRLHKCVSNTPGEADWILLFPQEGTTPPSDGPENSLLDGDGKAIADGDGKTLKVI
jgi:hypothetical protein